MMRFKYGNIVPDERAFKTVVLASGKSLEGFDINKLNRPDIFVITVNDSAKHAPFADAWFTLDPWGLDGPQLPPHHFRGDLYAGVPDDFGDPHAAAECHRIDPPENITYLKRIGRPGLSEQTDGINTGNSGFGAFNLAYLLGAQHILLLGIDCTRGYFYDNGKHTRSLSHVPQMFEHCLPQIRANKIKVFNGSPVSKVYSFTRYEPDYGFERFINEPR